MLALHHKSALVLFELSHCLENLYLCLFSNDEEDEQVFGTCEDKDSAFRWSHTQQRE